MWRFSAPFFVECNSIRLVRGIEKRNAFNVKMAMNSSNRHATVNLKFIGLQNVCHPYGLIELIEIIQKRKTIHMRSKPITREK